MALNGLFCADVPLRKYSLTHCFCSTGANCLRWGANQPGENEPGANRQRGKKARHLYFAECEISEPSSVGWLCHKCHHCCVNHVS